MKQSLKKKTNNIIYENLQLRHCDILLLHWRWAKKFN